MSALVLLSLVALAAEGARQWGQLTAAQRLEDSLTQRGWRAQWGSLHLGYDLTLTIDALEATHDAGAQLRWEQLRATLHLRDLLQGRRHPRDITLLAPTLHATPKALSALRDTAPKRPSATPEQAPHDQHNALPWPFKVQVKIQGGRVTLEDLPGVGDVHWEALTLHGGPDTQPTPNPESPRADASDPTPDRWRATLTASCTKGCGDTTSHLDATLRHSPADTTAAASFDPPLSWSGTLPDTAPGTISATLSRVTMRRDDQHTHLTLGQASTSVQWAQWAGSASVETLTVNLTAAKAQTPTLKTQLKRLILRPDDDQPSPDTQPLTEPWLDLDGLRVTIDEVPDHIKTRADAVRAQMTALQGHAGATPQSQGDPRAQRRARRRQPPKSTRRRSPQDRRRSARKTVTADPRAEQLSAALSKLGDLRDLARPLLQHVSVTNGELQWASQSLTLSDGALKRQGDDIIVEAAWQGMTAGLVFTPPQQAPAWVFRDLSIKRLRSLVSPLDDALAKLGPLKRLEGVLSGRLSVETRDGALPWEAPHGPRTDASPSKPDKDAPRRTGVRLTGTVNAQSAALEVKGLAPGPLEMTQVGADIDATWWWPTQQGAALEVTKLAVSLPSRTGDEVTLNGSWVLSRLGDRRLKPRVSLRVWVDEGDCASIVGAIPAGMLPNIGDDLALKGRFAPTLDFFIDMKRLHSIKMQLHGLPGTCSITDLGEFDPSYLAGDFKQEVKEGVTREGIFVGPQSGSYVPLRAMPHHLQVATYVSEEWNFYKNKGFDLQRTTGAVRLNLEHGRYVYGGSTLTQQLVKNLFLSRDKTLSRKLEEAFIVWKVEELLSKDRILELYLNCIEFGPNIYGIGRAAAFYFGKSASRLSLLESVFLAGIKPKPSMGLGPYSKGRTPEDGYWPERMYRVMLRMVNAGHLPSSRLEAMAPYTVYFRTWRGARPTKPGAPPPLTPPPN